MTHEDRGAIGGRSAGESSTLPFDVRDLMKLRVSPAQFSRMMSVSKTAVSQWIKDGKVTLGADGKLDPVVASRQVMDRTDPARIRARVLKDATASHAQLRERIARLEAERSELRNAVKNAKGWFQDDQAEHIAELCRVIVSGFDQLAQARAAGRLGYELDRLTGRIFYGLSDEQMAEWDVLPDVPAPEIAGPP